MLGFQVAQSTVSKYMVRCQNPPSWIWKTFLHNHAEAIGAIDGNRMLQARNGSSLSIHRINQLSCWMCIISCAMRSSTKWRSVRKPIGIVRSW
jgi:hypothetical protein